MPPKRQTQSYLRDLFGRRGIAPRHRYGQNFLIDLNIHELIVNAAEVGPGDVVLEVGPGAGALTTLMAERGAAVVAVDIDPGMARLAAEATASFPNVRVVEADALARKTAFNPVVLDNVRAGLGVDPGRVFKLVANLPYNVATPIVINLLVHDELRPERLVITIQKELADRMLAPPGTEAYGALSVICQALSEVTLVRTLPPSVFWPRPKVDSAVIRLVPDPARRAAIADLPFFHAVVRRAFMHRRKNLRGVLHAQYRDRWTKPEIDALLESIGIPGEVRAEAMNVEEFLTLADALKSRLGEAAPGDDIEDEPAAPEDRDDPDA